MISMVLATRNRGYLLSKTMGSYFNQPEITEFIFIDDCSDDNTLDEINKLKVKYKEKKIIILRNEIPQSAAYSKKLGFNRTTNNYVLFAEDDVLLEKNYCAVLLRKLQTENTAIASGRIIYLKHNEDGNEAIIRIKKKSKTKPVFNKIKFGINNEAHFEGDVLVPATHAIFITNKKYHDNIEFDEKYNKGNGYREETDIQINLFCHNYNILLTNETYCFHLNRSNVVSGGQPRNRLKNLYWGIYYTNYMYSKFFGQLKIKMNISYSKEIALILFALSHINLLFLKPLKKIPSKIVSKFYK